MRNAAKNSTGTEQKKNILANYKAFKVLVDEISRLVAICCHAALVAWSQSDTPKW